MPSLPPSLAPGVVVADRYRIEGSIGEGGYGAVFRATQLNLGRPVALKVLLSTVLDEDGHRRFQREAELAQRMEHPNTVRLLDFGRAADGSPFLVFELLKGQTLDAAIRAGGGLPATRVQRIATQILKALMEAHSLGIVHRDIKPANVFLCDFQGEPDFVKVLDFGIAKGTGQGPLTRSGQVVGTPSYMSPEQVSGLPITSVSDLYAVGLVMSEAITGLPVFRGASGPEIIAAQVSPAPVPHEPPVFESPLAPVIFRATQKPPGLRYASAAEMLAHLQALSPSPSSPGLIAPTFGEPSNSPVPEPSRSEPRASVAGLGHAPTAAAPLPPTNPPTTLPNVAHAPTAAAPALPAPYSVRAATAAWAAPTMTPQPALPPPIEPAAAKSDPPWVLITALCAGTLLIGATLVAVRMLSADHPFSGPPAPGMQAPGRRPLPRVRPADLTPPMIIERAKDAGYEIVSNSENAAGDTRTFDIGVKQSGRAGMVLLVRCRSVETARMLEDGYRKQGNYVVVREGATVLATMMANGAEPGNARARELLAAILR